MSVTEVLNMVLPFVYVLVFIALIWFIVELVFTVRKGRSVIVDTKKKIDPTLEHIEHITASLQPVAAKVDPLVERISLTVDAANLEIMRVDQILEDVGEITETISSAASAVDHAANAPMELVNNVTARVRSVFKTKKASPESVDLGEQKAVAEDAKETARPVVSDKEDLDGEPTADYKVEQVHATQAYQANKEASRAMLTEIPEIEPEAAKASAGKAYDRYFTYEDASPSRKDTSSSPGDANPWPESIPVPKHYNGTSN